MPTPSYNARGAVGPYPAGTDYTCSPVYAPAFPHVPEGEEIEHTEFPGWVWGGPAVGYIPDPQHPQVRVPIRPTPRVNPSWEQAAEEIHWYDAYTNNVIEPPSKPKLKHYRLRAFPREAMVEMLTKTGSMVPEDAMGILDKQDLVIQENPNSCDKPSTNFRECFGYPYSGFWVPIEVCEEIPEAT